jgi:hypothetical protein
MSATQSVWQRLSENQAVNATVFRAARIDLDKVRILTCHSCGLVDSALFWTPVKRKAGIAHLSCPACDRAGALYDLRHNRVRPRWDSRGAVLWLLAGSLVLLLSTGAFLRHAPPPEQLRYTLEQNWQQIRSLR